MNYISDHATLLPRPLPPGALRDQTKNGSVPVAVGVEIEEVMVIKKPIFKIAR